MKHIIIKSCAVNPILLNSFYFIFKLLVCTGFPPVPLVPFFYVALTIVAGTPGYLTGLTDVCFSAKKNTTY